MSTIPKYKTFGEEFKRLRLSQGISTHTELAQLLGVAQQTVSRWEAGASRPRAEQVAVVAKALRADPTRLLVAAGHTPASVTVSFEQPLPLAALSPEAFQRFCRSLLEELYPRGTVHAEGKNGHEQFGIDITVVLENGGIHSFQCKREEQFGPAKVKTAIKAHTTRAKRKFILLARIASPLARREVGKHRGWDIWDQEDLSEKLRSLPLQAKRRLVDTYFPSQRYALLGDSSPSLWLTPETFFAPLLVADRPFNHHWSLIGRLRECGQIAAALNDGTQVVVSLVGPAGGGKSRTLRAAIDHFSAAHPRRKVLMLSPTDSVTIKSLEDLGAGEKLLAIDDAHDRADLECLIRYAADPETHTRLLLVYRPYAQEIIDRQLGQYGLTGAAVALERPSKADAIALATHVLESLDGPLHAAKLIAEVAYDSPLSVVAGAWIVAKEGVHPELFGTHAMFQKAVLTKYRDAIAKTVSSSAKDKEIIERMLRVIALIQPLVPDDPQVLTLYESIEGVSAPDATRLTKLLTASGVLFKRGARYRLSPDLLADSIIESSYITESGGSNGQAERVFDAAISDYKAHLLLNLGRLDWRRNEGDTTDSRLLDTLWSCLRWEGDYVRAHITAAVEAAYFQPRQALTFARRLMMEGHGSDDDVCRMIRHAAYNLKYLPEACELLWELGRNDQRPLNQHPYHPLRLLTEMAAPRPHVPTAHVEGVVDFTLSLLPYGDSWTGVFTPLDVLEGALATEGHFTSRASSRSFTITNYGVDLGAVRSIRKRTLDAILEGITSGNKRVAFSSAKVLNHALRGPIIGGAQQADGREHADWTSEFEGTLNRVNALIKKVHLPAVVLVRIAESVSWHAFYSHDTRTSKPAKLILKHLDRDLETRTIRVLMDGWGSQTWELKVDRRGQFEKIREKIIQELHESFPDPAALALYVNGLLLELWTYGADALQSSHIFVNRLLSESIPLAHVVLDEADVSSDPPLSGFAPVALAALMKHGTSEAHQRLDSASTTPKEKDLPLLARAYSLGFEKSAELIERDRLILRRIFSSSDPKVVESAPWLFREVAECDHEFAMELLASIDPAMMVSIGHDLFMWLAEDKLLPIESFREDELRCMLKIFSELQRLDDYFVHKLLARVAKHKPRLVVDLAKERLLRATTQDNWTFRPIGHIPRQSPSWDILEHPDGPILLREFLNWSLPQIGNDRFAYHLSDVIEGAFGLRHPMFVCILEAWCVVGSDEHFKVAAHLLRAAPSRFVFEEHAFVSFILKAARSSGTARYRSVRSSLYAAGISGMRSGAAGEPFPQDVEMKVQAERMLATFSRGDPAYGLYDDLRAHAAREIERSLAEARALAEEDEEES